MIQPYLRGEKTQHHKPFLFYFFWRAWGIFITSKMVLFTFPPILGSKMKIGIRRTLQDKQESFAFEADVQGLRRLSSYHSASFHVEAGSQGR